MLPSVNQVEKDVMHFIANATSEMRRQGLDANMIESQADYTRAVYLGGYWDALCASIEVFKESYLAHEEDEAFETMTEAIHNFKNFCQVNMRSIRKQKFEHELTLRKEGKL